VNGIICSDKDFSGYDINQMHLLSCEMGTNMLTFWYAVQLYPELLSVPHQ
jgi:hypothetical protein